MNNQPELVFTF